MKTAILNFNPENNSVVKSSIDGLISLAPAETDCSVLHFKQDHDYDEFDCLILTGSCLSAYSFQKMLEENIFEYENYFHVHKVFKKLLNYNNPIFGICFGAQFLALLNGGKIGNLSKTEYGFLEHKLTVAGKKDTVFNCLPEKFFGAHAHNDFVSELPTGKLVKSAEIIAVRNNYIHAYKLIRENGATCYGVQPHPEMSTAARATMMITDEAELVRKKVGDEEFNKITKIPEDATFDLPQVVNNFLREVIC